MNTKCSLLLLVFVLIAGASLASAQETTCVYYFEGNGCQHCARVDKFFEGLGEQGGVDIHTFEIYDNRTNLLLLNDYFDAYGVGENERGIPVVFIGEDHLIGDGPIIEGWQRAVEENSGAECPGLAGEETELDSLSIATVVGAALVDSINPCAIAVLLILMGALLAAGNKKRALFAGVAFTVSIYIAYFLFGLGLFSALKFSGLSYWFYKIIGLLAIIIGLANIKDFFWYGGGGFVMEIPRSWRPKLKEMLGKVTSPLGAFLIGFVVCLFELPCTGGPYIVILGLLADRSTLLSSIPILLLYNLVFILPLLLITALIAFGFSDVKKANEWKDSHLRVLHLIAGIVMLVLGALIVLGFV